MAQPPGGGTKHPGGHRGCEQVSRQAGGLLVESHRWSGVSVVQRTCLCVIGLGMSMKKVVVVTGSTRGIGFGMAGAFLERDCAVVVCGRTAQSTARAAEALAQEADSAMILGQPCDVTEVEQVKALWHSAVERYGRVDVWINNAGLLHERMSNWELSEGEVNAVVCTNLLGTLNGVRVAMRGMLRQGSGTIYLMEGLGSDGRMVPGMSVYGATKAAIRYLARALEREARGTCVSVNALSPGMVVTDLLVSNEDRKSANWVRTKRLYNILGDRVDTVAPWLVDQILENRRHGARIAWLTGRKVVGRFLASPFRRRDLFSAAEGDMEAAK